MVREGREPGVYKADKAKLLRSRSLNQVRLSAHENCAKIGEFEHEPKSDGTAMECIVQGRDTYREWREPRLLVQDTNAVRTLGLISSQFFLCIRWCDPDLRRRDAAIFDIMIGLKTRQTNKASR